MTTISIAVPQAFISNANQLMRCVGESEYDELTFSNPGWSDSIGNLYAVASGPIDAAFYTPPVGGLVAPSWGADLVAASAAQAIVRVYDDAAPVPADPASILVVVDMPGWEALTMVGLTLVPIEV